mmetsp:Transcript_10005/g.17422  ORF Transcript_10005/g.17422 Transcript_10005/m.17422 type:complete len:689 (+) Transcript_10005:2245-4311(+)
MGQHVDGRGRHERHNTGGDIIVAVDGVGEDDRVGDGRVQGRRDQVRQLRHQHRSARRNRRRRRHDRPGGHVGGGAEHRDEPVEQQREQERGLRADHLLREIDDVRLVRLGGLAQLLGLVLEQVVQPLGLGAEHQADLLARCQRLSGPELVPAGAVLDGAAPQVEAPGPLVQTGPAEDALVQHQVDHVDQRIAVQRRHVRALHGRFEEALEGGVEEEQVALAGEHAAHGADQTVAGGRELAGDPPLVRVPHDVVEPADGLVVAGLLEGPLGHLGGEADVRAAVHAADGPQVVLHVVDQLRQVLGVVLDGVGQASQVLARDLVVVPQVLPEVALVARVEEVQVRLPDVHVVNRRVLVQLLMPLLEELVVDAGPVALLDPVSSHDVQDLQPDGLGLAASAAEVRDHHSGEAAAVRVRAEDGHVGRALGDLVLEMGEVTRLIVPSPVPLDDTYVVQPRHRVDPRHDLNLRLRATKQVQQQSKARENLAAWSALGLDDALAHVLDAVSLDRRDEVAAAVREPLLQRAELALHAEPDASNGRVGRHPDCYGWCQLRLGGLFAFLDRVRWPNTLRGNLPLSGAGGGNTPVQKHLSPLGRKRCRHDNIYVIFRHLFESIDDDLADWFAVPDAVYGLGDDPVPGWPLLNFGGNVINAEQSHSCCATAPLRDSCSGAFRPVRDSEKLRSEIDRLVKVS